MTSFDGICLGKPKLKDSRDAKDSNNSYVREPVVTARLPTEPNATHYNMNHKRRGIALIFNHESFQSNVLQRRGGTITDADIMYNVLVELDFLVTLQLNLSRAQLLQWINYYAKDFNHSDCDCFVVVVLTHGDKNGLLQAYDASYNFEDLWKPFSADLCPTLAGKPKLFFTQACQGEKLMPYVILTSGIQTDGPSNVDVRIPSKADFLFAYSTIPGYYSWRNLRKGSWFIQTLSEELKKNAYKYDILTILTFVNRRVALEYESKNRDKPEFHERQQIPYFTSRLMRLVKFNKKSKELSTNVAGKEKKEEVNIRNTTPKKVTSFDYVKIV